jgi:hypothetical protein
MGRWLITIDLELSSALNFGKPRVLQVSEMLRNQKPSLLKIKVETLGLNEIRIQK